MNFGTKQSAPFSNPLLCFGWHAASVPYGFDLTADG